MHVYIYQAALYCEDCGDKIKTDLPPRQSMDADSDDYPQGPYDNGGGEADCPQHCDACGVFLENPLTNDGYEYVREAIQEEIVKNSVVTKWQDYYAFSITSI